ncbi:MAG: hypothetical protein HEQ16_18175 [Bosea sp.]|jgi:hypothetical protein|nr:hypothetical protein [Bosea sp. (in: a-proteobacteria)]
MRGIVDILVGEIEGDDVAAVCIHADMQLEPASAFATGSIACPAAILRRRAASSQWHRRWDEGHSHDPASS